MADMNLGKGRLDSNHLRVNHLRTCNLRAHGRLSYTFDDASSPSGLGYGNHANQSSSLDEHGS